MANWISFLIVMVCCFLSQVTCRPADNDSNTIQYLPFYGGAKGHYLEITMDKAGNTIRERIVSEDSISNENIVKNNDENLISRVLAANLRSVQTLSGSILKLHNLGKRTGSLGRLEKAKLKEQLNSLSETSSNLIKLIEEIGDDVDILFKAGYKKDYDEENVGEEGVGIDSSNENNQDVGEILAGATIAEAKPIGLAVVGENGLAASRPVATAVAATGVAIARPIATAIAGIDPATLGITFQTNHAKKQ